MSYKITDAVSPAIFQAYDIRGIVDSTLNPDIVYTIALAIGSEARQHHYSEFVIARDGRLSGPVFHQALTQGLLDSGCNVVDLGAVPTPVLYFATHVLPIKSGVMLTGSHNPPNYNGFKIVIGGETLAEESIKAIYERIRAHAFTKGNGQLKKLDIVPDYLKRITQDIKLTRKLKVVVDCGNGIPGAIAPQLLQSLGCEVIELFCEVDGHFPHHQPDPSVPDNFKYLYESVKLNQADIGLAFDGDGDRLGVITQDGKIIWPDRQLMLFAQDLLQRVPDALIIYDVKCSRNLAPWIRKHHGRPLMWKTGHSLIKRKLHEENALLAGEMSGHIFFKERWYGFDDGLYAAARLLEILSKEGRASSEIFAELPESVSTPEIKLPIEEDRKFAFMHTLKNSAQFADAEMIHLDGLRVEFDDGWGLIRPSNTTPYLILRFEADNPIKLAHIQNLFREQILALDENLQLPF